jgi:hypothetical protein
MRLFASLHAYLSTGRRAPLRLDTSVPPADYESWLPSGSGPLGGIDSVNRLVHHPSEIPKCRTLPTGGRYPTRRDPNSGRASRTHL